MRLHAIRRQSLGRAALRARRQLWVPSPRQVLSRILHDGNTAAWYQPGVGVTGTLNASLWANWVNGTAGTAADLAQATSANQPIYLSHTGVNYAYLPGVAGNTFKTPDSAANSITGDIDIRIRVALDDWTPAAINVLLSKFHNVNGGRSWIVGINIDGTFRFLNSANGTDSIIRLSTIAPSVSDGASLWLRYVLDVDNGAAGNDAYFYTAPDSATEPTSWTLIEKITTVGTTSIFDSASSVIVGNFSDAADGDGLGDQPLFGKEYRATIYNGIGGTLAMEYNAADSPELTANGATFVSSTTGETYTLVNTGATPAQIVGSPSLLGNGIAHFMQSGAFTLNPPYCIIGVDNSPTWTSGDVSFDGRTANSFALQQITGTPQARMHDALADSATISPVLNTYNIISASQAADGTVSLQLNNGTPVVATLSATAMAGFTLWATGAGLSFGNSQKKDVIGLTEVPSTAKLLRIKQLLGRLHGISI